MSDQENYESKKHPGYPRFFIRFKDFYDRDVGTAMASAVYQSLADEALDDAVAKRNKEREKIAIQNQYIHLGDN